MPKYDEIPIDLRRTDQILRYIRNNPNCTKAMVIRHMKGRSSINTTHYIILNLIDKGKIIKNEVNAQTHLLTINEEDPFNMFHKMLVDIEPLVEEMASFITSNYIDRNPETKENPKIMELFKGVDGIENSYRQLINTMLTMIYDPIISSPGTFGEFYGILMNQLDTIYTKYSYCNWDEKTVNEVLSISSKNIREGFKAYNDQVKIKTNLGDRVIKALEDFRKEIFGFEKEIFNVPDPHEKSS